MFDLVNVVCEHFPQVLALKVCVVLTLVSYCLALIQPFSVHVVFPQNRFGLLPSGRSCCCAHAHYRAAGIYWINFVKNY